MCPICGEPLKRVDRIYPVAIVCYGTPDGNGNALYTDSDCMNKDCPYYGVVYSSAGGVGAKRCYICGRVFDVFSGELFSAIKAESEVYHFHKECQKKLK